MRIAGSTAVKQQRMTALYVWAYGITVVRPCPGRGWPVAGHQLPAGAEQLRTQRSSHLAAIGE